MEKFAVDLDKVLDELEYNEDRTENLAISGNRLHSSSGISSSPQDHGAVSQLNTGQTSSDSGDSGSKWRPKPLPVSQKTSVSGVFSSLNEYLNSGRVKASPCDSSIQVEDLQPQLEEKNPTFKEPYCQLPVWSQAPSNNEASSAEQPDLIDSNILHPNASNSSISIESEDSYVRESPPGSLLPDVAPAGAFSDTAVNDDVNSSLDLISNKSNSSDLDSTDVKSNTKSVPAIDEGSPAQNPVLSFGTIDVNRELNDEELNDYLSDLELEEQEQEFQKLTPSEVAPSCKLNISLKENLLSEVESQNESQKQSQPSATKELLERDIAGTVEVAAENLPEVQSPTNLLSQVSSPGKGNEIFVTPKESVMKKPNEIRSSTEQMDNPDCSSGLEDSEQVSPETLQIICDSPLQLVGVLDRESSKLGENSRGALLCDSQAAPKLLERNLEDSTNDSKEMILDQCLNTQSFDQTNIQANQLSDTHSNSLTDSSSLPDMKVPIDSSIGPKPAFNTEDIHESNEINGIEKAQDNCSGADSTLTEDITRGCLTHDNSVENTVCVEENVMVSTNASPVSTPPTVPVTPTHQDLHVAEDFASSISTSSTPFMTPTAVFADSSEFLDESCVPQASACSPTFLSNVESKTVVHSDQKPVRPSSLEIPTRTEPAQTETTVSSEDSPMAFNATIGPPGATPCANRPTMAESLPEPQGTDESATESSIDETLCGAVGGEVPAAVISEDSSLGKEPPFWVPDADAPSCMQCDFKFTVLKRRHHCRACGKVLCSKCCSDKAHLEYINAEARVCASCKSILHMAGVGSSVSPQRTNPNPNNPMEYCSTVSPLLQAAGSSHQQTPSVMVPVGVLKREGSTKPKSEAKQVMFSDGIRPGADLAELDGSSEPRLSIRRTGRTSKRVGTPPGSASNSQRTLPPVDGTTMSYVPHGKGLPPIVIRGKDGIHFEEDPDSSRLMAVIRDDSAPPVKFTVNRNLYVLVKILNLDCCVNRVCWCFTSDGLSSVGQDEVVIILQVEPEDTCVPKDIFIHLNTLYMEAAKGNTVTEMGHTLTQGLPFLGSKEHGGFLYVRPTFQCLHRLILPPAPYLVGVLIHKWETPWAQVFPIRLMLRLGAEFRYYPCPLVSIRQRQAVYGEIGHTIIQVLADFRNMAYTLPTVRGLVIHMEDKQTTILLPRNRYDQVMRALNNSNDHFLAFGANFSQIADSHLVCMQSDTDHSYHTQAINIQNKPRKVTGASFVVFNGALKESCGMAAKSSIVEDGLMVKVTSETMASLKTALRDMKDLSITCGPSNPLNESGNLGAGLAPSDEVVLIKWSEDDRSFNIGVLSSVDAKPLDGVPSIRVHNGTDYHGEYRFIRWTEVFILESEEGSGRTGDPVDISRLSEQLAKATCLALVKFLDLLAAANLTTLAVRATIHPENVGYQAGSNGEKLPPIYMNSLDNLLVPVLHEAGLMSGESPAVLELVFRIMESG